MSRGFEQVHGIDYNETFLPVVSFSTLRTFLAIVAEENLVLHQMDVKTAFLNGELEEDVFMEQPEGYVSKEFPEHVCKLQKALYGLKQSPRQWFAKINAFLCDNLQFQSCGYDPCFYVQRQNNKSLLITLYVDDLLVAGSSEEEVIYIKGELGKHFEMKDCGESRLCLGLEITRDRKNRTLMISQSRYITKILERFEMSQCKPASTPMSDQISADMLKTDKMDATRYRQAIGSLMYLMVGTRPDIAFATSRLSQYMQNPTVGLWTCVKRILRYISGTKHLGIVFTVKAQRARLSFPKDTVTLIGEDAMLTENLQLVMSL